MKFIEWLVEALNWLKIAASPTLLGLFVGFLVQLYIPGIKGIIAGTIVSLLGFAFGMYLAWRITKKMAASDFNARVSASKDVDEAVKPK